jgi:hypothetical protein
MPFFVRVDIVWHACWVTGKWSREGLFPRRCSETGRTTCHSSLFGSSAKDVRGVLDISMESVDVHVRKARKEGALSCSLRGVQKAVATPSDSDGECRNKVRPPSFLQTEKRSDVRALQNLYLSEPSLCVHPRQPSREPPTASARTLAASLSLLLTAGYVSFANPCISIVFIQCGSCHHRELNLA